METPNTPEAANKHWVNHLLTFNRPDNKSGDAAEGPKASLALVGTVAIMVMTENFASGKLSFKPYACARQLFAALASEDRFDRTQLLLVLNLTEADVTMEQQFSKVA